MFLRSHKQSNDGLFEYWLGYHMSGSLPSLRVPSELTVFVGLSSLQGAGHLSM
jgi:hypothetical protein